MRCNRAPPSGQALSRERSTMDVRAAVAVAAGKPLEVTTVQLEGPKEGEVLVEVKATGICHTDAFTLSGDDPEGEFPAILGHEGAGVVVEIGPGVKRSEEHTSELQSLMRISYAVFCLKKKQGRKR